MLRAYYAKSGSCHEPVRAFRFYAKVGTIPTRLNPYTSENRVSKPLTGNSCCICEARRGKARRLSVDDKYRFAERLLVGRAVLNFARSNIRSRFAAASIHTRGSKFDRANDELLEYAGYRILSRPSPICVIKSARGAPEIL